MSEHTHNTTRYWQRNEPNSEDVVYFTTQSNAAHARAEDDVHADEITQEGYEARVPVEARGAPFPPSEVKAVAADRSTIIEQYRQQCVGNMIGVHQQIAQLLMQANITHAERVFVLEMVKFELVASVMGPQQQPVASNDAVH